MKETAWLDCPYGRINDPFPGQCDLYLDTNADRLCDRSQLGPVGVERVVRVENEVVNFFLWSSFVILALYFAHWYLVQKTKLKRRFKWLNRASFRYFWNLLLLLTFIPVAFSGLLWTFGFTNFDFNLWHSRAGIVFTVVAALHLLGRWGYFVKLRRFFSTT